MEISINTRQIGLSNAAISVSAGNILYEDFAKSFGNGDEKKIGVPENWSELGVWISRDGYVSTNEQMKEFREIFSEKLGIDLLKKFFDELSDDTEGESNAVIPNIEYSADKLKEDFGNLLTSR